MKSFNLFLDHLYTPSAQKTPPQSIVNYLLSAQSRYSKGGVLRVWLKFLIKNSLACIKKSFHSLTAGTILTRLSTAILCLYKAATRTVAAYESGRGFRLEKLGRQSEWFAVLRSKRPRRSIFAFCASRHKFILWHVNFSAWEKQNANHRPPIITPVLISKSPQNTFFQQISTFFALQSWIIQSQSDRKAPVKIFRACTRK